MTKMKPCPFCGSKKVECAQITFESGNTIQAQIRCPGCKQHVSSSWHYEDAQEFIVKNDPQAVWDNVIELWNSRST
jgi:transcriptional regulator NrdR family protein